MIRKLKLFLFVVFGIGGMLGFAAFCFWSAWQAAHAATFAEFKRFFYTAIFLFILVNIARALGAVANYFNARAKRLEDV